MIIAPDKIEFDDWTQACFAQIADLSLRAGASIQDIRDAKVELSRLDDLLGVGEAEVTPLPPIRLVAGLDVQ